MKTLIQNSKNQTNLFNKYAKAALTVNQQKTIKGGEGSSIIIEDLIDV